MPDPVMPSLVAGAAAKFMQSGNKGVPAVPVAPVVPPAPAPVVSPVVPVNPPAPVAGSVPKISSTGVPETLLPKELQAPAAPPAPAPAELIKPGSKEDNLAHMRQRIADQQKIIDDLSALKSQYLDEAGKFKVPKEVADLIAEKEQKLAKMEDELSKVNFGASPEFAAKYQAPVDTTFQQISEIVKEFGGKDGMAGHLAGLPIKDRIEFLKSNNLSDAVGVLLPMYASLDRLLVMRHEALENHKQTAVQARNEDIVRREQATMTLKNTMRDRALGSLEQSGYFMFAKVPGNDQWNSTVTQMREAVDVLVKSNDVELQTQALALSVAAPVYRTLYEEERAARMNLEKQLRQYQTANPLTRIQSISQTAPPPAAGEMTAQSAARAIMQKISGN